MPVATENKDMLCFATENPITSKAVSMETSEDGVIKPNPSSLEYPSKTAPTEESSEEKMKMDLIAPSASPAQRSTIIFDWDDTLLASSYLSSKGYRLDTVMHPCEEIDTQLKQLEQSVIAVLSLALRHGDVHIITNAETGWVQLSAQKFIPGVVPLLSKITVISARSTFEEMYPDSPLKWKYYAFQSRISGSTDLEGVRHVISFGDSHVEREAVRAVTRGMTNVCTKSVKFAERPSLEQLRRQLDLVSNCFQYIYSHAGELDLMLTISLMY